MIRNIGLTITTALLLVVSLIGSFKAKADVGFDAKVKSSFNKLLATAELKNITLHITNDNVANAWANAATRDVYITQNLLKFCEYKVDCVAGVLAHELGHIHYGDGINILFQVAPKIAELRADRYGINLMKLSGFDCSARIKYMSRQILSGSDKYAGESHPTWKYRKQLAEGYCGK